MVVAIRPVSSPNVILVVGVSLDCETGRGGNLPSESDGCRCDDC